jgi:hypothetical protein
LANGEDNSFDEAEGEARATTRKSIVRPLRQCDILLSERIVGEPGDFREHGGFNP